MDLVSFYSYVKNNWSKVNAAVFPYWRVHVKDLDYDMCWEEIVFRKKGLNGALLSVWLAAEYALTLPGITRFETHLRSNAKIVRKDILEEFYDFRPPATATEPSDDINRYKYDVNRNFNRLESQLTSIVFRFFIEVYETFKTAAREILEKVCIITWFRHGNLWPMAEIMTTFANERLPTDEFLREHGEKISTQATTLRNYLILCDVFEQEQVGDYDDTLSLALRSLTTYETSLAKLSEAHGIDFMEKSFTRSDTLSTSRPEESGAMTAITLSSTAVGVAAGLGVYYFTAHR